MSIATLQLLTPVTDGSTLSALSALSALSRAAPIVGLAEATPPAGSAGMGEGLMGGVVAGIAGGVVDGATGGLGGVMDVLGGASGVQILAAVSLVGGLVLLAMGARVLSASVIVAGLATGAVLGLSLGRAAGMGDVGGVPGPLLTCGVGCAAGGLIGMALIRLAIGAASTATFGALGLLGSAAALVVGGALSTPQLPEARERALSEVTSMSREVARAELERGSARSRAAERGAGGADARASAIQLAGERASVIATDYWSALPAQARGTIVWSTLGGAVLGLALGTLMPRRTAALITALAGAGGAIVGARVLAIPDPGQWLEPGSPGVVGWLAVWILLAMTGLWVQTRFQRRGGEQASA